MIRFKKAEGFEPFAPGVYDVLITSVEQTASKKDGDPQLTVRGVVTDSRTSDGVGTEIDRKVTIWYSQTRATWKLEQLFKAAGFEPNTSEDGFDEVDEQALVGCVFRFEVELTPPTEDTGRRFNNWNRPKLLSKPQASAASGSREDGGHEKQNGASANSAKVAEGGVAPRRARRALTVD